MKSFFNFFLLFLFVILLSSCASLQVSREVESGKTALKLDKPKAALTHFEAAARIDPSYVTGFTSPNTGILTYLGRAYYESGQKEKALASLKRAKESMGNDYFAKIYFGLVLSQTGRRREGVAELETGLEGLSVWLQTLPDSSPIGQYWDPGNHLADKISRTSKMLQAEDPNWREITANVEWLGKEFEEESQAANKHEEQNMEADGE